LSDYKEIYASRADDYERLITYEDYQANLLPALNRIRPLAGLDMVELGAGTGRLTRLVAPIARSIRAFDASPHMLKVAKAVLKRSGLHNWHIAAADHRRLPVRSQSADVALAGWTLAHLFAWSESAWRDEADKVFTELRRVLRSGGAIIILETLGTGYEMPHPPENLIPYYSFLEQAGFSSTWLRTDFQFESLTQAEALIRFFFGPELAEQVISRNWAILPECTGIWWQNL
jgi:ubiquinone/menaquinone biosynthesis C-methylase UbiE